MEQELKQKFDSYREEYDKAFPNWKKEATDSTYFEMEYWYAEKNGMSFDEETGFPDEVYQFSSYVWDKLVWGENGPVKTVARKEMPNGIICVYVRLTEDHFKCSAYGDKETNALVVNVTTDGYASKNVSIDLGIEDIRKYDVLSNKDCSEIEIFLIPDSIYEESSDFVRIPFTIEDQTYEP